MQGDNLVMVVGDITVVGSVCVSDTTLCCCLDTFKNNQITIITMAQEQHTPEEQIKTAVAICVANLDISKYPSQDQIYTHLLTFVKSEAVSDYWQSTPPKQVRKITVSFVRDLESKLMNDEISYSKMVEMINEFFNAPAVHPDDQDTIRTSSPQF